MDPNENLKEQLEISNHILDTYPEETDLDDANRLAELVYTLNHWIASGGFLPKVWQGHRGKCTNSL